MNSATATYDPWAAASDPQLFSGDFWGQVKIDVWPCALVKGQGKVAYDPQVHDRRATAIDLAILTLPEQNVTNARASERHLIAESKEWASITWASLKALGVLSLLEIKDRWAHVTTVLTGREYEKDGQTKQETQFKFLALYPTEQECRAAYLTANGHEAPVAATPANGDNPEKAAALQFAKVIVKNACAGQKDFNVVLTTVAAQIAVFPVISKHLTIDSPEVTQLILEAMAPF